MAGWKLIKFETKYRNAEDICLQKLNNLALISINSHFDINKTFDVRCYKLESHNFSRLGYVYISNRYTLHKGIGNSYYT